MRPGAWITGDGFFSVDRMPVASEYGPAGTWLVIANDVHPTRGEYVEFDAPTQTEARKHRAELREEDENENV